MFLIAVLAFWLSALSAAAQNVTVTGVITDADTGEPLAGTAVRLSGSPTKYAVTDQNGSYSLSSVPPTATLEVSLLGYAETTVQVNGRTVINLELKPDTEYLNETIVVAFGSQTKASFTGSAAVVNSEEISKHTTANVANALVGSVPGLQMRGSSGAPGAGSGSINIRGIASMYASTDPLIIVDGAPYTASLTNIPQGDIESVSVLKDAASAALYGARGAAGVIIITTKRGKTREAVVNVDMKWGVNTRAVQDYDVIKDPGAYYEAYYQQFYNRAFYGLGYSPEDANVYGNNEMMADLQYNVYSVPEGQQLIGLDGKLNPAATLGNRYTASNGTTYYLTPDDWTDMAYKKAFRQEYNVSVNGASDNMSYYASLGYLTEDGVIEYSGYERISARIKADYQAKKWLKLGANVDYVHSTTESNPNMNTSLNSTNLMYYTTLIAPIYPAYIRVIDESGNPTIMLDERGQEAYDYGVGTNARQGYYGLNRAFLQTGNPLGSNRYNKVSSGGNQLNGTFTLDVDLFPFLKFNATSNINWGETLYSDYENAFYGPKVGVNGELTKEFSAGYRTNHVQTLTFDKTFGDHQVNILLGHEYYRTQTKYLGATSNGGFSPDIPELNAFANHTDHASYTTVYNVEGYFASAQYNYDNRYFASASFRRDASSYFAPEHRWGNFWSVGGAWLVNKESFLQDARWIDLLKLKLSYGMQGNDGIGQWAYTNLYSLSPSSDKTSMAPSFYRRGNPEITWETTANLNAGVEFSLWRSRLSGSVDVYRKKTSDLLFWLSIPESAGTRGYYGNVGDISNTGVEVVLQGALVRTNLVDWTVGVNLAHNTNKILELPESKIADNGGFVESSYWYTVGGPLYNRFTVQYAGVNEHGLATYWVDDEVGHSSSKPGTNHDSVTTNPNEASYYALGSILPKVFGGFNTSLRVGNFDITATFDYQIGGKVQDTRYASLMAPVSGDPSGYTFHKDYAKAWSPDNTSSNIPRWQAGTEDQYASFGSDRFLTDASYLNFQSFTVGYAIPKRLTGKIGIQTLRIYVAGENLLFWSARRGLDPRYSFSGNTQVATYSPIRTINGGVQITF